MLYDPTQTNNIQALQVVAATNLVARSIDNEIIAAAENLRLTNITQGLSEELARVRNTDVAGLNVQLSELQTKLNVALQEKEEALQQFATVKQREGTLKEELRTVKEELRTTREDLEQATQQLSVKAAPAKNGGKAQTPKPKAVR